MADVEVVAEQQQQYEQQDAFEERVIEIARVAKVVKGGRRFRFRVTVVVGDKKGTVGMGSGKANAVPDAMRKASERARKNLHVMNLSGTTIPHESLGIVGGARVFLKASIPRYRRDRGWRRARCFGSRGCARHSYQVHGFGECSECGDGNVRSFEWSEVCSSGGGPPRQEGRRVVAVLGTEKTTCLRKKIPARRFA